MKIDFFEFKYQMLWETRKQITQNLIEGPYISKSFEKKYIAQKYKNI